MVNITKQLRIVSFLFHQLSGASAAKVRTMASSFDAAEDKTFNNRMHFCFVLSRKERGGLVWCNADKARRYANRKLRLRLEGERCRFIGPIGDPDHGEEQSTFNGPGPESMGMENMIPDGVE